MQLEAKLFLLVWRWWSAKGRKSKPHGFYVKRKIQNVSAYRSKSHLPQLYFLLATYSLNIHFKGFKIYCDFTDLIWTLSTAVIHIFKCIFFYFLPFKHDIFFNTCSYFFGTEWVVALLFWCHSEIYEPQIYYTNVWLQPKWFAVYDYKKVTLYHRFIQLLDNGNFYMITSLNKSVF